MPTFRKRINSLTQVDKEIKKLSKKTGKTQRSLRNKTRVNGNSILIIEY